MSVCLSVCLSVCNVQTFECFDLEIYFWHAAIDLPNTPVRFIQYIKVIRAKISSRVAFVRFKGNVV